MQATAHDIIEVVGHMAEKLKEYKVQPGKYFADSLVKNVRELAELLPAFNLTNDPKLTRLTKRIVKELCAEDASVLRKDDDVRKSVAKSADDILADVRTLLA